MLGWTPATPFSRCLGYWGGVPDRARSPQQMWSFPFISVAEELHPISISDLGDNLILHYFNLHPQEQSPTLLRHKKKRRQIPRHFESTRNIEHRS